MTCESGRRHLQGRRLLECQAKGHSSFVLRVVGKGVAGAAKPQGAGEEGAMQGRGMRFRLVAQAGLAVPGLSELISSSVKGG